MTQIQPTTLSATEVRNSENEGTTQCSEQKKAIEISTSSYLEMDSKVQKKTVSVLSSPLKPPKTPIRNITPDYPSLHDQRKIAKQRDAEEFSAIKAIPFSFENDDSE
jgi:hypothetical protein